MLSLKFCYADYHGVSENRSKNYFVVVSFRKMAVFLIEENAAKFAKTFKLSFTFGYGDYRKGPKNRSKNYFMVVSFCEPAAFQDMRYCAEFTKP
jgi:hypothetical protein